MEIRFAKPEDVPSILELIKGLAAYENKPNEVENTVESLEHDIFKANYCEAIVVEMNAEIIGFSIFYTSYSTWKGPCLYLEDLFVKEEYRRQEAGSQLFDAVVSIAKKRGVQRMDWQVLDWNEPAIAFYKKKNAFLDAEWLNGRLFFK